MERNDNSKNATVCKAFYLLKNKKNIVWYKI